MDQGVPNPGNPAIAASIETPMLEATFAAAETPALRTAREQAFRARHPLGRSAMRTRSPQPSCSCSATT